MKLRWIVLVVAAVMVCAIIKVWLNDAKLVKASSDCPVVTSTPDNKGGALVVYDCGVYDTAGDHKIITIQQPVWP